MKTAFPAGHFYSPIVDTNSIKETLWSEEKQILGIDFNDKSHLEILEHDFPKFINKYDYPEILPESNDLTQFYTRNSQFSWLDSRTLFVLLNTWQPQKLIEVGSGFSSLLSADVNNRFLNNNMYLQCIEPYPREFLLRKIPGMNEVIVKKVEDLPLNFFENLEDGDVLFIDSSHISKTGSDVNYLIFEVLPRLKKGVKVHIHDIFLPNEYPKEWVISENRSWNEQYLLRGLLMFSNAFKVIFGCTYAFKKFPEKVISALNHPKKYGFAGSSFWIEKMI